MRWINALLFTVHVLVSVYLILLCEWRCLACNYLDLGSKLGFIFKYYRSLGHKQNPIGYSLSQIKFEIPKLLLSQYQTGITLANLQNCLKIAGQLYNTVRSNKRRKMHRWQQTDCKHVKKIIVTLSKGVNESDNKEFPMRKQNMCLSAWGTDHYTIYELEI